MFGRCASLCMSLLGTHCNPIGVGGPFAHSVALEMQSMLPTLGLRLLANNHNEHLTSYPVQSDWCKGLDDPRPPPEDSVLWSGLSKQIILLF